jgi:hypothetical protein
MYTTLIGSAITFFVGYILSYLLRLFNKRGNDLIYIDENKTIINADLFWPPIANMIRKRNAVFELQQKTSSKEKNHIMK